MRAFAVNAGPEATCPGCGRSVDPLRAGHVAIGEDGFQYFCRLECKRDYLRSQGVLHRLDATTAPPPAVMVDMAAELGRARWPAPEGHGGRRLAVEGATARALAPPVAKDRTPIAPEAIVPVVTPEAPAASSISPGSWPATAHVAAGATRPGPRERALTAIDGLGMSAGALAPAIGLLGSIADLARLPLAAVATAALFLRMAITRRDPADPHWLLVAAPVAGAIAASIMAPHSAMLAVFASLSATTTIVVERLVCRARQRLETARERIREALDVRVRVIRGDETLDVPAAEVRPGEQIVVEAGEVVGADGTVVAGDARVLPWIDARVDVVKREGDPVVAGARVVSSRLRMTVTWSGRERAWVKLLYPSTRVDVAAPMARALRHGAERGAPVAAALAGIAAFSANGSTPEILATIAAAAIAFGAKAVPSFAALHLARAQLDALANGIAYKDARAFERASTTDVAVLSARGTVLLGEPEIVTIEPVGASPRASLSEAEVERVLSLSAGAETASSHPFAAATLRAARTRGVRPDPVRNATVHSGLGVTALASTGERLVVGGRAIMLEEKIGVAVADARVAELEAQGRSVLLVALGERVIGLIALQDGLRSGARAAVQRLLDARIEPVLLSGEARDTCETIGRALDIDHVRPEVLPGDRGAEVRALTEGGSVVGVLGHPASDDGALGAADVAVAMGAAGSTPGEWAVALAGDDVRDAATALALPRATRARIWAALAIGASPGLLALLTIAFGIAPLAVAPLATLLGAVATAVHARETDR